MWHFSKISPFLSNSIIHVFCQWLLQVDRDGQNDMPLWCSILNIYFSLNTMASYEIIPLGINKHKIRRWKGGNNFTYTCLQKYNNRRTLLSPLISPIIEGILIKMSLVKAPIRLLKYLRCLNTFWRSYSVLWKSL